jgi:hypothetical protein
MNAVHGHNRDKDRDRDERLEVRKQRSEIRD